MKIFKYGITDSTNTRAREYANEQEAVFPSVFIAEGQSAGRGRRGRSFDSERGAGLYISFLFKPKGGVFDPTRLTVKAAVTVARALENAYGLSTEIKWVNDIYFGGKKLAGILAEGEFDSDGKILFAVCGIGVNIISRRFPDELSDIATTVEDCIGSRPDIQPLCDSLIDEFFKEYSDSEIIEEYRRRSAVLGRTVEVSRLSGERFIAKAVDITDSGALVVELGSGERESLISAEVSLKIKNQNWRI